MTTFGSWTPEQSPEQAPEARLEREVGAAEERKGKKRKAVVAAATAAFLKDFILKRGR